jgi:hypothetical protein
MSKELNPVQDIIAHALAMVTEELAKRPFTSLILKGE